MKKLIAINSMEDYNALIDKKQPYVLDFLSKYCVPCQMLTPTLELLICEFDGAIPVYTVDVEQVPELAIDKEINAVPSLYFIHPNKPDLKVKGLVSENDLRERFQYLSTYALSTNQ